LRLLDDLRAAVSGAARAVAASADVSVTFEIPPQPEMGDLSSPVAFELARLLRRPPRAIAGDIAASLQASAPAGLERAEVAGGGYLNLFLDRAAFLEAVSAEAMTGFAPAAAVPGRVIVEHTNINPNKAAHIGHLRNAILGDTLVRCLRQAGRSVEIQNYIDDTGVQVADLVVGLREIDGLDEPAIRKIAVEHDAAERSGGRPFDHYCWDAYARVGPWYQAEPSRQAARGRVLHAMESGQGEEAAMAAFLAARMSRHHVRTMDRLGIRYDLLPRESDILRLGFWAGAFEQLKAHGAIHRADEGKNRGCWVMDLDDETDAAGSEQKIIVRSDGTVTYVGKDIAYQLWKFGLLPRDFRYAPLGFEGFPWRGYTLWGTTSEDGAATHPAFGRATRVYNVIDVGQSYLQRVVVAGLKALGHEAAAADSVHFSYEKVALSPASAEALVPGLVLSDEDRARPWIEMSGRRGLGVKADDLIDALEARALNEVRQRHPGQTDAEARAAAHAIAVAALRYYMLRFTRNRIVAFDIDDALSFEGETGPYCQYAVVRARSILAKAAGAAAGAPDAGATLRDALGAASRDALARAGVDHWRLIREMAELPAVAASAVDALEPSLLARWGHRLAQSFNTFYHQNPVLHESDPGLRRLRTAICALFVLVEERTLALLGIAAPARM